MPSLCLSHLPLWAKTEHLRKAFKAISKIDDISILFKRIRVDKGYITFKTDSALQQFKDGHPYNLKSLGKLQWDECSDCDVTSAVNKNDEYNKKRVRDKDCKSGRKEKKAKTEDKDEDAKTVRSVVSHFADLTYQVQLLRKKRACSKSHQNLTKFLLKHSSDKKGSAKYNFPYISSPESPACPVLGILGSPVLRGYRNFEELTCGLSKAKEVSVGYQLGRPKEDDIGHVGVGVDVPDSNIFTQVMADVMKKIIEESDFITYRINERKHPLGVFRNLTLRTTGTKTALVLIALKTSRLSHKDTKELREFIKERILAQLEEIKMLSGGYEIKSLQLAKFNGFSSFIPYDSQLDVVYGSDHIIEEMLGFKFRISPFSFFHVNTKSAENLYRLVADYAGCNKKTILFDVCCGTGPIGITLAKHVSRVYGFEINEKAVEDCKWNAKLNGCENIEYFLGNCEETLPTILSTLTPEEHKNVILVLDPLARKGIHKKALMCIRATPGLDKIVYVSCRRKTQIQDMMNLCMPTSTTFKGKPFRPIKSTVVDLFPNTRYTGLITLLTRVTDEFQPEKYDLVSD